MVTKRMLAEHMQRLERLIKDERYKSNAEINSLKGQVRELALLIDNNSESAFERRTPQQLMQEWFLGDPKQQGDIKNEE